MESDYDEELIARAKDAGCRFIRKKPNGDLVFKHDGKTIVDCGLRHGGRFVPTKKPLSYKIRHVIITALVHMAILLIAGAERLCMPDLSPMKLGHIAARLRSMNG